MLYLFSWKIKFLCYKDIPPHERRHESDFLVSNRLYPNQITKALFTVKQKISLNINDIDVNCMEHLLLNSNITITFVMFFNHSSHTNLFLTITSIIIIEDLKKVNVEVLWKCLQTSILKKINQQLYYIYNYSKDYQQ